MSHTQTQAATVHLTDANFEDEVIRSETPRSGGFLGRMVRPLPDYRPGR